ncbi:hypothetical protein PanWU01x14_291090 [Parasponia andersonii]|uniref:Uncharacterized protein n=1 Tax=Parasponia andersonii TaxID=3476 RepID=A0A2P5AXD1_PARAD|nr:hypothetical protein PanWU01x14_291090 [Parasponia andersonii]
MRGFDHRRFRSFSSPEFTPASDGSGGASRPPARQHSSPVPRSSGWVARSSRAVLGTPMRENGGRERERDDGERENARETVRVSER